MKIEPARRLRGSLRLPGDKSISHRAAMMAALAHGQTRITNYSTAADCASTLSCLRQLGVSIEKEGDMVRVKGAETGPLLRRSDQPLDCGNSGSTIRMLAGVLAGHNFASTLTGDDSLRSRPMKRIIEPLERMGARVSSEQGRPPLHIEGRNPLTAISYEMPVASAQVKSCILLAGLNANGRTEVIEKFVTTRDHTERMLRWFGVQVETKTGNRDGRQTPVVSLEGPARLTARDYAVPGDISSAAFFLAAATLLPESDLQINGVGLNPTRAQIVETLQSLGADVQVTEMREQFHEDVGDIQAHGGRTLAPASEGANVLRGSVIAQLIDELPVLAVVGTQVEGGLEIREAAELRVKETDRISATVKNLRAMGAEVEEYEDGLAIAGRTRLHGAKMDSYGDHRIAMAFTVAALIAEDESEISGAECVGISFPEFFQLLESVIER